MDLAANRMPSDSGGNRTSVLATKTNHSHQRTIFSSPDIHGQELPWNSQEKSEKTALSWGIVPKRVFMTAVDVQKIVCPRCAALMDVSDRYCRQCGEPTSCHTPPPPIAARTPPQAAIFPPTGLARVTENPWVVLSMLFLVAGPFALPLLWRSRAFSQGSKIVLTMLVLTLTAFILFMGWFVMAKLLDPMYQLEMSLQK
jgi:hypothetical protein